MFSIEKGASAEFNAAWFRERIETYVKTDDVFHVAFLQIVILYGIEEGDAHLTKDASDFLKESGTCFLHCHPGSSDKIASTPGPYALMDGALHEVWRLYPDSQGCFMSTVEPVSSKSVPVRMTLDVTDRCVLAASPSFSCPGVEMEIRT